MWHVEPNLLSHTAHSISRKGVKKRDLSDVELRDILSEVLPHIRTDHVLPKDSEVLTNAIKRGLVSVPPSHMIGSDTIAVGGQSSASAWVRTRNMALFIKPRLFVPYFDEVKVKTVFITYLLIFLPYCITPSSSSSPFIISWHAAAAVVFCPYARFPSSLTPC